MSTAYHGLPAVKTSSFCYLTRPSCLTLFSAFLVFPGGISNPAAEAERAGQPLRHHRFVGTCSNACSLQSNDRIRAKLSVSTLDGLNIRTRCNKLRFYGESFAGRLPGVGEIVQNVIFVKSVIQERPDRVRSFSCYHNVSFLRSIYIADTTMHMRIQRSDQGLKRGLLPASPSCSMRAFFCRPGHANSGRPCVPPVAATAASTVPFFSYSVFAVVGCLRDEQR